MQPDNLYVSAARRWASVLGVSDDKIKTLRRRALNGLILTEHEKVHV